MLKHLIKQRFVRYALIFFWHWFILLKINYMPQQICTTLQTQVWFGVNMQTQFSAESPSTSQINTCNTISLYRLSQWNPSLWFEWRSETSFFMVRSIFTMQRLTNHISWNTGSQSWARGSSSTICTRRGGRSSCIRCHRNEFPNFKTHYIAASSTGQQLCPPEWCWNAWTGKWQNRSIKWKICECRGNS